MMNRLHLASLLALTWAVAVPALRGQWIAPTAEELSMTSIPEVPGASAIYLYKEEMTEDQLRMHSFYVRLKVLNDGGKDYANVEIPSSGNAGISVDTVAGRTIHSDGTIIPFTGKPYEKVVEKIQGYKFKVKVFTLPSVDVGSIVEYRYKLHYDDAYFMHPDWYIQSNLFTRKAHYSWKPNGSNNTYIIGEHGESIQSVAWTPILPPGAKVVQTDISQQGGSNNANAAKTQITLDVSNVPPLPHEDYMPPMDSLSYRVLFYYTGYKNSADYWTKEGKYWAKDRDKFIGPGPAVGAAVKNMVGAGDTQDQKLRKIYAAVIALENTDFTRARNTREEHAAGLKEAASADDILTRKRGSGDQLTELFVAMARAAGFKAYLMAVANRNERIFLPGYLSMRQLDDYIAIVNVDGKEQTFDPGQRYCAYGRLAWQHTFAGGLRQNDGGVVVSGTGGLSYKDERTGRVADLALDEHGAATGTVTLTFNGDPALHWRQDALRGDETSLNANLKVSLEHLLPGGMDVRVTKVENLTDAEKPLVVSYQVSGAIGSSTGKRLLVPANLFEANAKPRFPETKRELPVDMEYPSVVQDAVRVKYPESIMVESAPAADQGEMKGLAAFNTSNKPGPNSITSYRNVTIGFTVFPPNDYSQLRSFYSKLDAKGQETLVLTHAATAGAKTTSGAN